MRANVNSRKPFVHKQCYTGWSVEHWMYSPATGMAFRVIMTQIPSWDKALAYALLAAKSPLVPGESGKDCG